MQQFVSLFSVALYGSGIEISRNYRELFNFKFKPHEEIPWLMYYSCWHDPWLLGDSYSGLQRTDPLVKLKKIEENVYSLTPRKESVDSIRKSLKKKHQWTESYWLNWNIIQGIDSFRSVFPKRKIFIFRKVMSSSLGDEEVLKLLGKRKK